ncbi:MAG: biotin--[acetyl-CoA-carboxylase] ligase [Desulfobacterales bacterium]|jgi:BirA family biotin operon repressor/biotin-[acetyl-CoA-carboxylase] ligase|nr:biotin--[acetyl-CoA-carboxylase] ligase [Desulfobacterales bacterium]
MALYRIPGRENAIHYFPEIESTMDEARNMAQKGCPAFTVVVAEQQRKGRGRMDRQWVSTKGGLYFTLVLRPDINPADCGRVNFLVSVVLANLLRKEYHIDAGVKWPNDILVDGKKIAGMLSEMATDGHRVQYLNIGIGLNVNNDPCRVEPNATTMKMLLGERVRRTTLLGRFLNLLEEAMVQMTWEQTLAAWRNLTVTLGRPVRVVTTREIVEGTAMNVDDTGALILKTTAGTTQKIIYGDCFINPS